MPGGGPTAVARRSATGGGLSPATMKVRTVLLPYLYTKGSGMTCPAPANAGSSAKGVSWCCSDLCKTETFIACVLSPSIVTLAAMKYSSTTSPPSTQDATSSSSSSQDIIVTYHFTVTNGQSTTQSSTSGPTTVSPSAVTVTTERVSSTLTTDISNASSATSATTTSATPVETPVQPTTSSITLDSGDKKKKKLHPSAALLLLSTNSCFHSPVFTFFMLPSFRKPDSDPGKHDVDPGDDLLQEAPR